MKRSESIRSVSDTQLLGTTEQVTDYLKVPAKALAEWRSKGTGPRYSRVGKYVRYSWRDVETWLTSQAVSTERA